MWAGTTHTSRCIRQDAFFGCIQVVHDNADMIEAPGTGSGRRRPPASARLSSVLISFTPVTRSVPTISSGCWLKRKLTPSSLLFATSRREPGLAIRGDRAQVREPRKRSDRRLDDPMTRVVIEIGDQPEAAAVTLE